MALGCVGFVSAQANPDLPPSVVDCTPKPFETNVDPGLTELSVTFDRPMSAEGALTNIRFLGVNPVPQGTEGRWDGTGTVFTVAVELQPDVMYCVATNTAKGRVFKDTSGKLATNSTWCFATGERAPEDFPPHVVSCTPAFGATDVDFRLREVTFTFDRPIAPGDFSCVLQQGSGEYPAPRGGSLTLSDDRLTGTLEVRLSPGTTYALGVNDYSYCGYKDTNGRPVLPFGWCFRTAD